MDEAGEGVVTETLFPTFVHRRDLPDSAAMNAALLERIRALRGEDPKGLSLSNQPGLGGWHSKSNLQRDPAFKPICDVIGETMRTIAARMALEPRAQLVLLELWSIVNPPGSYNSAHIHPGVHFSGVYYVQAPPKSGNLVLRDPRSAALMMPLVHGAQAQAHRALQSSVPVEPKAGRIVVFPSWLMHSVEPNLAQGTGGEAERVILSFNLGQTPPR